MYVGVSLRLLHAPRLYEYLLAMGALLFVSLQAIINIGVVTGSMPTKGMSLPFISYGGSNLMVTFIFVGLIINVFRVGDPNPSNHRIVDRHCMRRYRWTSYPGIALAKASRKRGVRLALHQSEGGGRQARQQVSEIILRSHAGSP